MLLGGTGAGGSVAVHVGGQLFTVTTAAGQLAMYVNRKPARRLGQSLVSFSWFSRRNRSW